MIKRNKLNVTKTYILFTSIIPFLLFVNQTFGQYSKVEQLTNCFTINNENIKNTVPNNTFAVNDTFELLVNCYGKMLCGDVLSNDSLSSEKVYQFCAVNANGIVGLTFGVGKFTFTATNGFTGIVGFSYELCEIGNEENKQMAEVIIYVHNDFDCDNVPNEDDLDDDNDGILDIDEGDGLLDSDLDSIPDSYDIDSDNDGIPDNIEWQNEGEFIMQTGLDLNQNGWDNAYDITSGGTYYEPVDTDNNGVPDYLDTDSDYDGIFDRVEGFDANEDGLPHVVAANSDTDKDGLDDAFDTIEGWLPECNSAGSNCSLPDSNKNGIRDWREVKEAIPGEDNSSQEFSPKAFVFPNPSNGNFTVNIPLSNTNEEARLTIYNISGKLIYKKMVQMGLNNIKLEKSLSGLYLAKITSSTFNYNQKITLF